VSSPLALIHHCGLVGVEELDRILHRHDVAALAGLMMSIIEASVVDLPEPSAR